MTDYLRWYREAILPLMRAGESPLALESAGYIKGEEIFLETGQRRPAEGVAAGVSFLGLRGTLADEARAALARQAAGNLLVTTSRLAVIPKLEPCELSWACGVERISVARPAPRLLQRGRVVLAFDDDSALAVMLGVVDTGPATRLLRALGGARQLGPSD